MSKLKLLSIAVIGLLLLNIVVVGYLVFNKPASREMGKEGGAGRPGGGPKYMIIERLHFDEAQARQMDSAAMRHRTAINQLEDRFFELKANLYNTLADTAKRFAKDSIEIQIAVVQKQMEDIHYKHFEEIRSICRPEQLSYYNELSKDFSKLFMPNRRSGPSGGPRPR